MKKFTRYFSSNSKQTTRDKYHKKIIKLMDHENIADLKRVLIKKQVDFNYSLTMSESHHVENQDACSLLHIAATRPNTHILKLLLDFGCSVDLLSSSQQTALHFSCAYVTSDIEIIDVLIDHGIDINAQDCNGKSALHCACESKNHKAVKQLLQHDATDVTLMDVHGLTALDIAKRANCTQSVLLLESIQNDLETPSLGSNEKKSSANIIRKLQTENRYLRETLQTIDNMLRLSRLAFLRHDDQAVAANSCSTSTVNAATYRPMPSEFEFRRQIPVACAGTTEAPIIVSQSLCSLQSRSLLESSVDDSVLSNPLKCGQLLSRSIEWPQQAISAHGQSSPNLATSEDSLISDASRDV